ncbi:MAG: ATP-dependent zinc metalloprotease FtsH [Planctomycetota bacterium]|nr:ATP-dependent zinc metalloprotease FtsH [Planctomycetota bacterium]
MESPSPEKKPESDSSQKQRKKSREDAPRPLPPGFLLFVIVGVVVLLIWNFSKSMTAGSAVDYSFFFEQLSKDNVAEVTATGSQIEGRWRTVPDDPKNAGTKLRDSFETYIPVWARDDADLRQLLKTHKVEQDAGPVDAMGGSLLIWMLIPAGMLIFLMIMMRGGTDPMGQGFLGGFARSPAKKFQPSEQTTSFADVAAMDQAKSELMEVVDFLKTPERFQRLGAQIPKGVLLIGSPGTGKTLLARATAGEAGVPFYSINGSEFIQMFVGVGASRVRDLFQTAKDNAPCIIFIDEIDAVGRHRGAGLGGGHDEREQTLNQILSEMDGFEQTNSVIVVAATNRPDVLDPALLRPGRFDRHVTIDRPTKEGRAAILKVHSKNVPLGDDVDLVGVAASTTGFSGAELKNLVNEAALCAVRVERDYVTMDDFDGARDRVIMGPKREEVLNQKERRMTAYHEAGHALLGWFQPEADEVHKVSIIPRGRALGVTQFQPDEERFHIGEQRLHQQLAMMLAGRAAEKLAFDEYSAGAEDDLKRATQIARSMVAHWGMSDEIGPVAYRQGEHHPFLGKEIHESREFSEETAHLIDQEITQFLRSAQQRATQLLVEHRSELDIVSEALLDRESLGYEDLVELIGKPVVRAYAEDDSAERDTLDEAEINGNSAAAKAKVGSRPSVDGADNSLPAAESDMDSDGDQNS